MKITLPKTQKPSARTRFFALISSFIILHSSFSQQFLPQTNTTVTIPPVIWQGPDAGLFAHQLMSLTNASGGLVFPPGLFTNRSSSIYIRVEVGTNGLKSIRARIQ